MSNEFLKQGDVFSLVPLFIEKVDPDKTEFTLTNQDNGKYAAQPFYEIGLSLRAVVERIEIQDTPAVGRGYPGAIRTIFARVLNSDKTYNSENPAVIAKQSFDDDGRDFGNLLKMDEMQIHFVRK